jgi:polysaccharide biosynthesis protein PslG
VTSLKKGYCGRAHGAGTQSPATGAVGDQGTYHGRMPERRGRKPVLAGVLVLCVLAWLAPATAAIGPPEARSSAPGLLGGLNIHTSVDAGTGQLSRELAWARALHAKVVRVEIPWSSMEPLGPGRIDPQALAFTDRLVADAEAAGLKLIMIVDSTPCWASSAPASLLAKCSPQGTGRATAYPPTDDADYAAFVAYLAKRYGPELAALEIWNEPDQANEDYFAGPEKAERYAALLRAAYPAIKQADSSVVVLAGSLVGPKGLFLKALYAEGIKGYYDALAVHFYTLTLAALRETHEIQLANGDDTPLWLDEFGWSSCYPHQRIEQEQACVTDATQARNLANTVHALARLPYVAAAVMYKLQDTPGEQFGLVTVKGARKPSFAALAKAFAAPLGPVQPVSVSLRSGRDGVEASGSGPVGDFMELEAFQGSLLRYRAIFTLDRFNHYSIRLPSVLGTQNLSVRVYQYGAGPARAARAGI